MARRVAARTLQALLLLGLEAGAVVLLIRRIEGLGYGGRGHGAEAVLVPALVLGLVNAVARPLMVAATVPMGILGFATVTTALNCLLLLALEGLGFLRVTGPYALMLSAGCLAVINAIVSTVASIDDEDRFYRRVIRRMVRGLATQRLSEPGVLVLEIDGLAYTHLQHARSRSRIPHLDGLIRSGGHTLLPWDCGVPSQTSSSQAGIMYGDNDDIPAFRWYDREREVVVVSGNTRDASELEARLSHGNGLLRGGASVNNLLSGDAETAALTLSRLGHHGDRLPRSGEVLQFFTDPYCLSRALILIGWEMLVQGVQTVVSAIRHLRRGLRHGPLYPLQRALSTVLLRDLSTYLVVRDLVRGAPAIYVSYIGYDVVSHERGPTSGEALGVLSTIDRQVGRLLEVARRHAPRRYHAIVLSDHGHSPGQSFAERHGITLTALVESLVKGSHVGEVTADPPRYLHALLEELRSSEESPALGETRRRALRRGRLYLARRLEEPITEHPKGGGVVVCCSGNLAHVYLPQSTQPLCLEDIDTIHPGLVPGLLAHPGIGFVMVRSSSRGLLALGRGGLRELDSSIVEGDDPLRHFDHPRRVASQLVRLAGFPHCGDMVVNSAVEGQAVFSFENQRGSHGGLGGPQNYPFIVCPHDVAPSAQQFSSVDLYQVLARLNPQLSTASG